MRVTVKQRSSPLPGVTAAVFRQVGIEIASGPGSVGRQNLSDKLATDLIWPSELNLRLRFADAAGVAVQWSLA